MAAGAPWDMEVSVRTLHSSEKNRSRRRAQAARLVHASCGCAHVVLGCSIRVFGTNLCERHLHVFFMVEIQGTVDNSRPVGVVHPSSAATTSYYWQQYGLERKR